MRNAASLILLFACLASLPTLAAREVTGAEHWVQSGDIKIYLWEKYLDSPSGKKVVVLAHGSATAGRESFDLQVPGKPTYSVMDFLAREGFDVFALDVRGFGRSTHPDTGVTTRQASEDLNAVVDYVLKLRGAQTAQLLAWSWGTQYGGMFVMAHPEKLEKYISYAQMHVNSPDIARRRPRIEEYRKTAYTVIPKEGWKGRFFSLTPASANDPDAIEAFAEAASQAEPKTATGPQLDMVTIMPMVNPRLIPIPVMIIHGEYDDVANFEGLLPFFEQLPNQYKKYVVIPNAGHMMMFQKGRGLFQHEVASFLKADLVSSR